MKLESIFKSNKKMHKIRINNFPWWSQLLLIVFVIILILFLEFKAFIILFVLSFFLDYAFKYNKRKFYKLEGVLPTSSIRSVSMGLAEISGTAKSIEPIVSRIANKSCIGYLYTIESISKDNNGRYSYSLEFSETNCSDFFLEDKTGKIRVLGSEIEFYDFEIDEIEISSSKRHTQYLLKDNMQVLIIGRAAFGKNNDAVFQKEEIKNIFGMAPINKINNRIQKILLWRSAIYFIYIWAIIIVLILFTPIRIQNNMIKFGELDFNFQPFNNK